MDDPKKQDKGSPAPIAGRCGRKLTKSDPPRYCTKRPMRGRTACRNHGGASLTGPAAPNWRGGRSSDWILKALPLGAMRKGYADAVAAGELRTLRREIGITAGLKAEALERMAKGGGSFADWTKAGALFAQLEDAVRAGRDEQGAAAMKALGAVLKSGAAHAAAAADLAKILELERTMRETESRMSFRMAGQVTVEQLLAMMRQNADLTLQAIALATRKGEQEARRWFAHEARALASGKPAPLRVVR